VSEPTAPSPSGADSEEEPREVRVVDKRWWAQGAGATVEDEQRSDKPSYVADLERQLAEKDGLLRDYAAKYKEASKEFEEARVRMRREIAKDVEREKRRVLAAFLNVVDNLDRAIEAGRAESADSALLTGVEMVRQQFLATLDGYGVAPIDAAGETFDPTVHDAVSTVPVADAAQDNVVIDIVTPGYRVEDEVLRPASVTVGKHAPS
jgi:molecular chaperone GrpE